MEIHDLNTGTPAATHVLAMDTGSDTYKTTPGNVVPDYTSGDSSTATSWTTVTAVASGLSFSTLIGRITTMMKNVRYLYNILGSDTFSTVASTITGAIGNTALGTTATTLSGAIAEHESDIGTLNSNFSINNIKYVSSSSDKTSHTINVPNNSLHFLVISSTSTTIHAYGIVATTSAGAVNIATMQTSQSITLTAATGAITVDVGSTARPLQILDIAMRGADFCTLS